MKLSLVSSLALASGALAQRTLTVNNDCPFTIWPALFTGAGTSPNYPTGWKAPSYSTVSFQVPHGWISGRIWGRRDCDFTTNPGPNSCLDGGCIGGLQCEGGGVPPATLAEFTLDAASGNDYYDVSLVDGYNLPVAITNDVGCPVADCPVDLGPNCPSPLKGPFDSNDFPVGCSSACQANLDGTPSNSTNCCTGQYDMPSTCPPTGVAYYSYFKDNCPNAYCYAYDESSGSALWTCPSSLNAQYTVTFCPSPDQL